MNDMGCKNLSGIKSMYVNSLACVSLKGGESECFRIECMVRQRCMMFPWLFNVFTDGMKKEGKIGIRFLEEVEGWIFPDLLYAEDLTFVR